MRTIGRQPDCDLVLAKLRPLLEDEATLKIGHNLKYDLIVLRRAGADVTPYDDTMLISYVLDAGVFPGTEHPGVWAVNEPDGVSTWMPLNDHPTDKATWTFELTVPEELTAVSNGAFLGSVPTEEGTTWTWGQSEPMASYRTRFADAVADDLGTPRALAVAHEVASAADLTDAQRRALLLDFDGTIVDHGGDPPFPRELASELRALCESNRLRAGQRRAHLR